MIVKTKHNTFVVMNHDGTKLLDGPFKTKAEAEKRLGQIEYFKNRGKK